MQEYTDFKILVVDDDPDLLRIIERILISKQFAVSTADTGQACLQAIRLSKPHLLLLDVMLPDISGVEVCKTIKSDPEFSLIYVILLSGLKTESDNISEGLESGADGYLTKPMKNRELLARVEAAFRVIRAESTMQESIISFRAMADHAPVLIWRTNKDKLCDYVNLPWLDFTGCTLEEELGSGWANGVHPEDFETCLRNYHEAFDAKRNFSVEYRLRRADGAYRWVLDNGVPRYAPDGTFEGFIGSCIDIHDHKIAEYELNKLNTTLEDRVAFRTKQLDISNQELNFHLRESEQFTFITSHDLQEPLLTITTVSGLLQNEYAGKLDENGKKYIEIISDSAQRMKVLVKGLLDYTLMGKSCVKTRVDCNNIVEEVLCDLDVDIKGSNAKITIATMPVLIGYRTELKLLFQHLLSNAILYTNPEVRPEIKISAEQNDKEYIFSVEDNGIGIEEKDKEKIFIIFRRMHNRNEYKGTGIGLAHCKKIAELHGGKIWVETQKGIGSTFKFTIPAAP